MLVHFDFAFQNKYRPSLADGKSYPLVKRGIYYIARQISEQLGRVTGKTNYADVEKAIGIWIVNEDIPLSLRNTATRYFFHKEDFIGETDEPHEDYDLMEVILIRRGRDDTVIDPLFQYLKSVYDADIEAIDRYTPASANPKIMEEVKDMPGMSQLIYEGGYRDGISQGISQGQEALISVIRRLMGGETTESILASGVDDQTLERAINVVRLV